MLLGPRKVRPGMRDRFGEFLPLLLVGVVLLVFQLTRQDSSMLLFQSVPEATEAPVATAAVAVAGSQALALQRRPTSVTAPAATCSQVQPRFNGGMASLKQV